MNEQNWKNAALRLGEELSAVGPQFYYNMNSEEWLSWALKTIRDCDGILTSYEQSRKNSDG